MNLISRIMTVGGFTLLSRIFGLVRDFLMARYLGAGMAADAFFIAFKLPNFFRRLFAEGAFSTAFVPLFSRALGKDITPESQAAAEAFAGRVFSWLLPVLILLLIVMELAMVPVMLGLTGGFDNSTPEKFDLVVELGRYTFPYLVLISIVSFYAGMLNAVGRFSAAAFAPVILNIFMIAALLGFNETEAQAARMLAGAVSLSGLAQMLLLYASVKRAGLNLTLPKPHLSDDVRELLRIMAPAAIGAGVMQINLLADVVIAARLLPEGSVSWLFYADRLAQLPLGVIGIAAGTVLLPSISRLLSADDDAGAAREQNRALEFTMLLTLPAAAALATISLPLIATIFERGAFLAVDTLATSAALFAYAFGLPAYVIQKILTPGYFARKDTKTPVIYAAISLVTNLILNLILIRYFAHVGLAIATAIAAWLNVALLYFGLSRRGHFKVELRTIKAMIRHVAASAAMIAALYSTESFYIPYFAEDGLMRILALGGVVTLGASLYFLILSIIGGLKLSQIRLMLKRAP
ncbi:MAG: murein biosynthesis integral membrane protein MurJ [Kordiimonadaceae bacterium]|nr:murein biosynthesis integral membrane protein MurJ [Kordiimonadaceae bacterium]MBO6568443.1 murein biosynthesis integral membrane protein MurJ [Kordiimonadaceae bacterium]MBO6963828.1 murein biosynthesis integral membrane protein MurJ [Kordiimonadaceae bacterium]